MITWGSTTLNVLAGTWSPSQSKTQIKETELLPDPSDPDAIATVLHQGPRTRRRASGTLRFSAMSEYNALLADKDAATARTLDDDDTVDNTYYIESLGAAKVLTSELIMAVVTFVEG